MTNKIKITKAQWDKIHKDYKSESKDKKGCFLGCIQKDGGTTVVYAGIHFEII